MEDPFSKDKGRDESLNSLFLLYSLHSTLAWLTRNDNFFIKDLLAFFFIIKFHVYGPEHLTNGPIKAQYLERSTIDTPLISNKTAALQVRKRSENIKLGAT